MEQIRDFRPVIKYIKNSVSNEIYHHNSKVWKND